MELIDFEFKRERKLGEFVQDFINLLKVIIGHLTKTLFGLLVLPTCAMLLIGFYLSTQLNFNVDYSSGDVFSVVLTFITVGGLLFIIGMIAFGFSIEYFLILRDQQNLDFGAQEVWANFKSNIHKYFRFLGSAIIVGILASIPLGILMFACMFIPFAGSIGMGILFSMVGMWFFTAFMLYREGYYELIDTFTESYYLLKKKIFEFGVASYVVGFLYQSLMYIITIVPVVIIGLIAYNSIGFNDNFFETYTGKVIVSLGSTILTLFAIVYSMLSVLSYGIIYETAKELKFGESVFERISKIGRKSNA